MSSQTKFDDIMATIDFLEGIVCCHQCGEGEFKRGTKCPCGDDEVCRECCEKSHHCLECKKYVKVEGWGRIYDECGVMFCEDCWNDEGRVNHYLHCDACRIHHLYSCDESEGFCSYLAKWMESWMWDMDVYGSGLAEDKLVILENLNDGDSHYLSLNLKWMSEEARKWFLDVMKKGWEKGDDVETTQKMKYLIEECEISREDMRRYNTKGGLIREVCVVDYYG